MAVVLDQHRDGLEGGGVPGQHKLSSSPSDLQVEEAQPRSDGEDQTSRGLAVSDEIAPITLLTQDIFGHRPGDGSMVDERSVSVPLCFCSSKVVIRIRSP